MLIHLGEDDEYITNDARAAITKAVAHNAEVEVLTYPGCRHAFARHGGQHFDATAAALANSRTVDFFATHGW